MKYPGEDFFRRLNPDIRRAEEQWEEANKRRLRLMRVRWYIYEGQHVREKEGIVLGTFRRWFKTWLLVATDDGDILEVKSKIARPLL